MYKRFASYILLLLVSIAEAQASQLEDLHYITEDYPPFNYQEQGKLKGIAIDLLHLVWQREGMQAQDIDILPWARAMHLLKHSDNAVLFAVAKTPQRTDDFKWACPIVETRYVLFAKKRAKYKIDNVSQLEQYTIGTIRADVGEQALMAVLDSPVNIFSNVSMAANLDMLERGRIQLVAYDELAAGAMFRRFGYDPADFEVVFPITDSTTCYAFSKNVPDSTIATFQGHLNQIVRQDGYQSLVTEYFAN